MTIYQKINKFLANNNYMPDTMYGDDYSCVIKYNLDNKEARGLYCKLRYSINKKPNVWGNADIKMSLNLNDPSVIVTVTANSIRSI